MRYQMLFELPCAQCKHNRAITVMHEASNEDAAKRAIALVVLHQYNFHVCKTCSPNDATCHECKRFVHDAYTQHAQIVSNVAIQASYDKAKVSQKLVEQNSLKAYLLRLIKEHKLTWDLDCIDTDSFTTKFQSQINNMLTRFLDEELTPSERERVSRVFHSIFAHQLNRHEKCDTCYRVL